MEIIRLSPDLYSVWNRVCAESDEAWFWHTAEWLQYTLEYRPDWEPCSLSFLVQQDRCTWAICPLMVETRQSGDGAVREGSYGGGGCPAPALARGLSGKVRRDLYAVIADEIDRLAGVHDIQRISFRQSPPAPQFWRAETAEMHPLLRHGYLDTSLATQVIDVSQAEGDLLKDMRKGHRYDVKRSQGLLNTQLFDRESISAERFQEYREMHHRAAGRVTRPPVTFQMMYEWILKGQAALACAELQGRSVGYAVISIYKDGAYYSSSCEEPGLGDLPIGHAMQWAVVRWLRTHGFRNYEIGIQPNGQIHNLMSEKELKIALFKRGFGGRSVNCWAGEKFYSKKYWQRLATCRARDYAAATFTDANSVLQRLSM